MNGMLCSPYHGQSLLRYLFPKPREIAGLHHIRIWIRKIDNPAIVMPPEPDLKRNLNKISAKVANACCIRCQNVMSLVVIRCLNQPPRPLEQLASIECPSVVDLKEFLFQPLHPLRNSMLSLGIIYEVVAEPDIPGQRYLALTVRIHPAKLTN